MGIKRHHQDGFTLIELLVTMTIFSILASLAVSTYTGYIQASKRSDAHLALYQLQNLQEKYKSNTGAYSTTLSAMGWVTTFSPRELYVLRTSINAAGFTLTATPRSGYSKEKDTTCTEMSLSHSGIRSAKDTSGTDTTDECWVLN